MHLSVITDEISDDLGEALRVAEALGIEAVELRSVGRRNLVEHDRRSIDAAVAAVRAGGFRCPVIDSPFLKTPAPEARWADLERAFEIASCAGAPLVRVFSGLRGERPGADRQWLLDVLREADHRAAAAGLRLAVEIEFVCAVATAAEARELLDRLPGERIGIVWDPGNEARFAGSVTIAGLRTIVERVVHVHVKDVDEAGEWVRVGRGIVGYKDQLTALAAAGYDDFLSVETHYRVDGEPAGLPGGGPRATTESVTALRRIAATAGIPLG